MGQGGKRVKPLGTHFFMSSQREHVTLKKCPITEINANDSSHEKRSKLELFCQTKKGFILFMKKSFSKIPKLSKGG